MMITTYQTAFNRWVAIPRRRTVGSTQIRTTPQTQGIGVVLDIMWLVGVSERWLYLR
jgi:hypothetical protein